MWLHITETERDVQFMTNVSGVLQNFYIQNILPEVLTRNIENSTPKIFDGQRDKLYCFCNSPYSSDETWIGCDSEKFKWEWFHLSCVNLKRVPRNNWYCPDCCKEKPKMAETCDVNVDIYENIVVFIELKCLHKCSQLWQRHRGVVEGGAPCRVPRE